jgi:endonuclease/exonuclease/phosphatase (EEP) superfamily protein YafD
VKKWEVIVLSKIQALQATADAEKIQVQVGNQTQELGAAQAKYNDAAKAHTAHGVIAKALKKAVHDYVAEKEFDEELVAQYVHVRIPPFRLY